MRWNQYTNKVLTIQWDTQKERPRGVAVNMSPCHGEDRQFKSDRGRHFFFTKNASVAQSVEQRTENPCVDSSILSWGTI